MLTITDLFCGAGGSSSGAIKVPGVRVRMAANHWRLAVETHNTNHPDTVRAVQAWKRPDRRHGRYKQQYVYRCPTPRCHIEVMPEVLPAAVAIDWSLPGERIGGRARPLAPKTLARIEAGLRRYARSVVDPMLVPAGGTRTTRDTEALVAPEQGRGKRNGVSHSVPAARNPYALVMRNMTARGDQGQMSTPVDEPLRTQTASSVQSLIRWDHLLVPYYGNGNARPLAEPAGTVTTVDRNALVSTELSVEDCTFRMLEPHEIQAAMAFDPDYVVLGNKRERVRQLGNAVTPPAARDLVAAVVEAITGEPVEVAA